MGLRAGDRYLIVNPFFHTFGYKAGFVAAIMRGATIIPHAVFDPASVLSMVASERITMLPGPPALHQQILDHPDRSQVRPLVAAAVRDRRGGDSGRDDPPHARRAQLRDDHHRLRPHRVDRHGVDVPAEDDAETIATTSGRAIPDVEVRIADGRRDPRARATT